MAGKGAVVAVGVVVVLAAGAVLMTARRGDEEVARLEDEQSAAQVTIDDLTSEVSRLETELAGERRRAQRSEVEVEKLRRAIAAAEEERAAAAETPPADAPAAPPTDWHTVVKESYPVYAPDALAEALGDVDWEVVAESMSNMPSLIAQLAEHIEAGKPMTELPAETVGSIQRFNGPLVTTAMQLSQKGVAGSSVNGAFSNPGFMSNALASTLLAMGMPLDDSQSARLASLTEDYSAREARRAAGYGDDAYVLEQLVDESRLKHEYFQKVYAILSPEQHAAVRPEAVRGRTQLDIFCESLTWSGKAGPLLYTDRADLAAKTASWIGRRAGLPEGVRERAGEIVSQWAEDLPDDFVAWEPDGLVEAGMLQVEHVTDSAARVLALLRTLEAELGLDDAGRARLRSAPGSIVPYRSRGS